MRFNTRNAYYLRVSANTVLPLYLYLDEQHVDWMSERVLQHVLADLRPLIIPKLIAEETIHLGPGGPTSAKKGTLDVHRGDTYQFGYFLRNTEPHAVLIKTRRFTAAPPKPKHAPRLHEPVDPLPEEEASIPKKRGRVSKKRKEPATNKRNTGKGQAKGKRKGKQRATEVDSEEEEAIELSGDEEEATDAEEAQVPQVAPRRSARKRNVVTGGYREDEENVEEDVTPQARPEAEDVEMAAAEAETPQDGGLGDANLIAMDEPKEPTPAPVHVKFEQPEPTLPQPTSPRPASPITLDSDPPAPPATTNPAPDTLLVDSDEEEKPKPIMKLHYQGFSIGGRCLCVIVEPYPPLPKPPRAMSLAPTGLVAPRAPSIAPADFVPSGQQQRGKTPLFLPEDDREATPAPRGARERSKPPVPLFYEEQDDEEEDDSEERGGMLAFSQILQSVGEYATGAAEDDDDIEGAVFFGDADENREL